MDSDDINCGGDKPHIGQDLGDSTAGLSGVGALLRGTSMVADAD